MAPDLCQAFSHPTRKLSQFPDVPRGILGFPERADPSPQQGRPGQAPGSSGLESALFQGQQMGGEPDHRVERDSLLVSRGLEENQEILGSGAIEDFLK